MGGGHEVDHHHDHHAEIGETRYSKVPDYRIYKVENVPELVTVQRMLAQRGLKDPWARNHVWKYTETDPWFVGKKLSTEAKFFRYIFRGLPIGLAAATVTIIAETAYHKMFPKDDHGHAHH